MKENRYLFLYFFIFAIVGYCAALWISLDHLEGIPHVQDEIVYDYQAKLISQGKLWEPEALPRAAHSFEFVINSGGRRFGIFPNGWPAVLAIGKLAFAPWAVNPFLHGITVILAALLAFEIGGRKAAYITAPIAALNPALVIMAASRMSHTLSALLALVALRCAVGKQRRAEIMGFGCSIGYLFLTRPMDGLIVFVVLSCLLLYRYRRDVFKWLPALLPIVICLLLLGVQNRIFTGRWTQFVQDYYFATESPPYPGDSFRYSDTCNKLGFGKDRGCFPTMGTYGHTPQKAWEATKINMRTALRLWFGVPLLSLVALSGVFFFRRKAFSAVAVGLLFLTALLYSLYWYRGTCFGARFYHIAAPPFVILTAFGISGACDLFFKNKPHVRRLAAPIAATMFLVPCFRTFVTTATELEGYWGVDHRLARLEKEWPVNESPVFMVAYEYPLVTQIHSINTVGEAFVAPFWLRRGMWFPRENSRFTYVEYQAELVEEIITEYPNRQYYLLVLGATRRDVSAIPIGSLPERRISPKKDLPLPTFPALLKKQ